MSIQLATSGYTTYVFWKSAARSVFQQHRKAEPLCLRNSCRYLNSRHHLQRRPQTTCTALKDLESLADSFTPILACLTRQPETSSDVLYFPKSNARQSTAAQSQNTFIEEIQTMSLQIVAYFNTLLETDPDLLPIPSLPIFTVK